MKSVFYTVPTVRLTPQERARLVAPKRVARFCGACRRRTWHTLTAGKQHCTRCQQTVPDVHA